MSKNKKIIPIVIIIVFIAIGGIFLYNKYGTSASIFEAQLIEEDVEVESRLSFAIAPAAPTCVDTDEGKTYGIKGTVISNTGTFIDKCDNYLKVKEYYCDGTEVKAVLASLSGYNCVDGKLHKFSCFDSDGGIVYDKKGSVKWSVVAYKQGILGEGTDEDECYGYQDLREQSCDSDNAPRTTTTVCSNDGICKDGACVDPESIDKTYECSDSDGGHAITTKGTVTWKILEGSNVIANGKQTDLCDGSQDIIEFICSDNTPSSTKVGCGSGYICFDGVCKGDINNDIELTKVTCYYCEGTSVESVPWDNECPQGLTIDSTLECATDIVCSNNDECDDGNKCTLNECAETKCTVTNKCSGECNLITGECGSSVVDICTLSTDCKIDGEYCIGGICTDDSNAIGGIINGCKTYQILNDENNCAFSINKVFTTSGIKDFWDDYKTQSIIAIVFVVALLVLLLIYTLKPKSQGF